MALNAGWKGTLFIGHRHGALWGALPVRFFCKVIRVNKSRTPTRRGTPNVSRGPSGTRQGTRSAPKLDNPGR